MNRAGGRMKITVIGATGLIGTKLVTALGLTRHSVYGASSSTGVNALTGEGLDGALDQADVLIDVTNTASFGDAGAFEFFRRSSKTLIDAASRAGVGHYLALSVVGTDRLVESDYFRAKMVQENLIRACGIPYTIVRSTQFFEFSYGIVAMATNGDEVRLPPVEIRPIAADDTVQALAEISLGPPFNKTLEVAGPQTLTLDELARTVLTAHEDNRVVTSDPKATYFGVELARNTLLPVEAAYKGSKVFGDWLYKAMER